ncbi:MAG: hypothetical protein EBX36_06345 [Planctomycetia bacterium]|nr:hypothetical protein [Planctomycetia bacterium]
MDFGDTLASATVVAASSGSSLFPGRIGDGRSGSRDVDLFKVVLRAGQSFTIDVDARSLPVPSTLDSVVRVFDVRGRELARNDDAGGSLDSLLSVVALTGGTFFVGISGYGNAAYSAIRAGSGRAGSTGTYEVAFRFGALPQQTPFRGSAGMRALGAPESSPDALQSATCQTANAGSQRPGEKRWTIVWR